MMNSVARPRRLLLALYLASVALVTVQQAILGHSNNFRVFRSASLNLFAGRDLYAAHPEQHFDFYKYSPTFALLRVRGVQVDRKSTRLNSSHVRISYAVFCLKKKK